MRRAASTSRHYALRRNALRYAMALAGSARVTGLCMRSMRYELEHAAQPP